MAVLGVSFPTQATEWAWELLTVPEPQTWLQLKGSNECLYPLINFTCFSHFLPLLPPPHCTSFYMLFLTKDLGWKTMRVGWWLLSVSPGSLHAGLLGRTQSIKSQFIQLISGEQASPTLQTQSRITNSTQFSGGSDYKHNDIFIYNMLCNM